MGSHLSQRATLVTHSRHLRRAWLIAFWVLSRGGARIVGDFAGTNSNPAVSATVVSDHRDIESHRRAVTQGAAHGRIPLAPHRELAQTGFIHAVRTDPD